MRNKSVKKNKNIIESDDAGTDDASAIDPSERLRAAREALGISIDEVAHDLHLDHKVIVALESADYDALGAPVFVRGYMRSYARRLNLPEDDVVSGFVVTETEPEEFRTLSAHTIVKPGASMANFMLWVMLVIVVLAGLAYLLIGDEKQPAGEIDKGEFVAPVTPPAEVESEVVAGPAGTLSADEPEVTEPVQTEPEPAEPVVEEPLPVQLTLSFAKECWVEVSDAQNRLLYGLEKPDTSVTVEGEPPFRLFLGDVKAVTLELGGEEFKVPRAALSGNNTARFTINAADVPEAKQQ